MWIKWFYNDHGCSGWKELEVPNDVIKDYGSVENYLCEINLVPTYSERFMMCRIKWKKIKHPSIKTLNDVINSSLQSKKFYNNKVKRLKLLKSQLIANNL